MPRGVFANVFGQIARGVDGWVEQHRFAPLVGCQPCGVKPAERFYFAPEFVDELRALEVGPLPHPERVWALIAKGDEVLDWREMTARYPGSQQVVLEGGDHAISDFAQHLPQLLEFLDLQPAP